MTQLNPPPAKIPPKLLADAELRGFFSELVEFCRLLFESVRKRRVLAIDAGGAGNVGAGEDNLLSYAVPGGTLSGDGDALRVSMAGTFSAACRLRFYFGASLAFDTGAMAIAGPGAWSFDADVIRTGAASQKIASRFLSSDAALPYGAAVVVGGEALSGAATIKATAEAAADDDARQETLIVEFIKA